MDFYASQNSIWNSIRGIMSFIIWFYFIVGLDFGKELRLDDALDC